MKNVITMITICLLAIGSVMAGNMYVDVSVTATEASTTTTFGNFQARPWCELESIHIAFPPVSTSTVSFWSVCDNGVNTWQIGDSVTVVNTNVTASLQSYYPRKEVEFVSEGGSTNNALILYPIIGTVQCVISKTGATSQTFKSMFLVRTE